MTAEADWTMLQIARKVTKNTPAVTCLTFLLALGAMSCSSHHRPDMGLVDGKLAPCPSTPNCVSSESSVGSSHVAPLSFNGTPEQAWETLRRAVEECGGKIKEDATPYLWATFTSRIFRFVDDVEFRMDARERVIQVRSASRVGYSDLGVNRKRVEKLRAAFAREQERVLGSRPARSDE